MTFTVYENNRTDQPHEVDVGEIADKVEEADLDRRMPLGRQINLVLAEIGSFDPQTDEYAEFERAVADELTERDQ